MMPTMKAGRIVFAWLAPFACSLLLFVSGCSKSADKLLQTTITASHAAESAALQDDARRAKSAAESAAGALRDLEQRAESDDAAKRVVGQARLAALAARNHAEKADERQQRRDSLGGLKAKAYRGARGLVIRGLCSAAAFGAEKAAASSTNDLTVGDWNLTRDARKLVALTEDTFAGGTNGPANWTNVATSLRQWATNPPPEANVSLALSLLGSGQRDLALVEVELMTTNGMTSTNALLLHHGTRALVYSLQGWSWLAASEVELFAAAAPGSDYPVGGENALALVHGFLAVEALTKQDWRKADKHISDCVRISPTNFVTVYLTGERLAANGDWEKAAQSLEAGAANTPDSWLAGRLAERARALRDGKGSARSMVLDPKFLIEVSFHYAVQNAKTSEAAAKLESYYEQSAVMGKQIMEKLPFGKGDTKPQ